MSAAERSSYAQEKKKNMHIDRQGAAGVKIKGVGYLLEITGTYVVQVGVFFL